MCYYSGALEALAVCLEEFDPGVKEAAAWALGYIARHNSGQCFHYSSALCGSHEHHMTGRTVSSSGGQWLCPSASTGSAGARDGFEENCSFCSL